MNNKTPLNDDLYLVAYLAGELTTDEVTQFERAVEQDPLLAADLAALQSVWDIPSRRRQWDTDRLRKAFFRWRDEHTSAAKHTFTQTAALPVIPAGRRNQEYSGRDLGTEPQTFRTARQQEGVFSGQPLRRRPWYIWAEVAVGVLTLVIGWLSVFRFSEGRRVAMAVYETGNGQRANVTLTDSTLVTLNVASRLEVPADYPAGDHTVRLRGEALFTVMHHAGAPLTVISGPATTQVLGTSFLVRHYTADRTTTVAVRDGKVSVRSEMVRPVVLTAARQVEIGHDGDTRLQAANPAQFTFATGILTLTRVPFSEAITELDRWYDADIRLGDPALRRQHISGEYAAGTLADLANILELTSNDRVVRHGKVLTLMAR